MYPNNGRVQGIAPVGSAAPGNTSTTPLASGATFTGAWETNAFPDVMVSCQQDNTGTLYFDFSNDGGTTYSTFPPTGFDVASGVHEFHTAVKGPRSFRVRFVNDAGSPTYLRLYTYYGTYAKLANSPVNFSVAADSDAILTKSVLSGIGNTTAIVTDHGALRVVFPKESTSAFGDVLTAELTPVTRLSFYNGFPAVLASKRENQSGTVTVSGSLVSMSTGAATDSSAEVRSKAIARYDPGEGNMARFTGVFTTGVAGSTQKIGIGNTGNGLFFGYNGTSFGVCREYGGSPEIQTLTVSVGSSDAENITITLDGDAASVAVTATGDTTLTANEIAAHDYSDVGRGWDAYARGSTVEFVSWDAAVHNGTFSLGGASSAVGTFAQNVAGAASTEEWIPQASWNGEDIFDGNGQTGETLDPTKGNVFQIRYQWLGFGSLGFFIEDPDDGEYHLVHNFVYANNYTTPSLIDPSVRLQAIVENTTNDTDIVMKSASMGLFKEGQNPLVGPRIGVKHTVTNANDTESPVLSVRLGTYQNSTQINTSGRVLRIAVAVEHTKPVSVGFYANPTLTGGSFSRVNAVTVWESDTSATAFTGGIPLFTLPLGKSDSEIIDLALDDFAAIMTPGDVITATAETNSGNGGEVTVTMNLFERA
jgi:hypothetical protein